MLKLLQQIICVKLGCGRSFKTRPFNQQIFTHNILLAAWQSFHTLIGCIFAENFCTARHRVTIMKRNKPEDELIIREDGRGLHNEGLDIEERG